MKKKVLIIFFTFFIFILLTSIVIFLYGLISQTQLVGEGQEYVLETEDLSITMSMFDKYWQKTGCENTDSGSWTIDACNVQTEQVGEELGCPIYNWYTDNSYFNCPDKNIYIRRGVYRNPTNECAYGQRCNPSDEFCSEHCDWEPKVFKTKGSVILDSYDNCAWYVIVKDKEGNLIKEFSQIGTYGDEWPKTNIYYRGGIDFSYKGTNIKKASDVYGIVQRRVDGSSIKSCLGVNFVAEDDRFRYNVCLGNDGLYESYCKEVLVKECKLSCPIDKELDLDSCACIEPVPDCYVDGDCGEGFVCSSGLCILEDEPLIEPECTEDSDCQESFVCENEVCVEEDEPPIVKKNWWKIVGTVVMVFVFILSILLLVLRRKK